MISLMYSRFKKAIMQNMLNMQQKHAINAKHDIIMQNRSKSFH